MLIQHSDINVSPASYSAHLTDRELLVTSMFYTIQGEGPWAGCPAVFVRLAGCNRGRKETMGCQFCDTRFTFAEGKATSFEDIVKFIGQYEHPAVTIITGGEPMMQNNLSRFIQYHKQNFSRRTIQVESNGDRIPPMWPHSYAQIVVSPKINKDGYHKPRPDVLKHAMCFKFVVSADPESPYYNLPAWVVEQKPDRIFVSPMTIYKKQVPPGQIASAWDDTLVDKDLTRANYRRAAKLALEFGFRISLQTHLWLELE